MLSPLIYALYSHDSVAKYNVDSIYMFTDVTTVISQINVNDVKVQEGIQEPRVSVR